ncbi:MAG: hypothetical protein EA379_06115 [Phycisphaerales bacterium]|nr:MAG: hypothetical protein EA379_06115 [Phycisphaerales bacterium]
MMSAALENTMSDTIRIRLHHRAAAALIAILAAASAHAGKAPDYGLNWVTIGAPGNRGALASELPTRPQLAGLGAVDYRYRMTRTEVTHTQYFNFVQAYAPYVSSGHTNSVRFHGGSAHLVGFQNGVPQYQFNADHPHLASQMSWQYAARFVNWLHNDKVSEQWAFESGVYDTSFFGQGPNSIATRSSDAKYWIPSIDEWAKAAHYDPNRYGEGQEGYWLYPYQSEVPLQGGPPGSGAMTNAGNDWGAPSSMPVGSYPHADSPWGLLDVSGGAREWLEDGEPFGNNLLRLVAGSALGQPSHNTDRLDRYGEGFEHLSVHGLRIASAIPSPGAAALCAVSLLFAARRRRG